MKDVIKVGEYVRSKDGRIGKILEPKREYFDKTLVDITKEISVNVFIDYGGIIEYCKITEKKKHSKNIVDIVEPGDYVNKHLVVEVEVNICNQKLVITEEDGDNYYLKERIKSILTHEQYEKNCYKMEE